MGTIHRSTLSGRAACGAGGRIRLSTSGVGVTCGACKSATMTSSEKSSIVQAQIRAAAAGWRGCTAAIEAFDAITARAEWFESTRAKRTYPEHLRFGATCGESGRPVHPSNVMMRNGVVLVECMTCGQSLRVAE